MKYTTYIVLQYRARSGTADRCILLHAAVYHCVVLCSTAECCVSGLNSAFLSSTACPHNPWVLYCVSLNLTATLHAWLRSKLCKKADLKWIITSNSMIFVELEWSGLSTTRYVSWAVVEILGRIDHRPLLAS